MLGGLGSPESDPGQILYDEQVDKASNFRYSETLQHADIKRCSMANSAVIAGTIEDVYLGMV